jgi:hypothetical protein
MWILANLSPSNFEHVIGGQFWQNVTDVTIICILMMVRYVLVGAKSDSSGLGMDLQHRQANVVLVSTQAQRLLHSTNLAFIKQ